MIGQLQPVRVAPEGVDKTLPGQLRQVVLAAEVGQYQVLQVFPAQLGHQACGLVVVQMSFLTTYPLFEKPGVVTTGEQVAAMVGLDHQRVQAAIAVQYAIAVRTQVGQQAETPLAVTEYVLGGFLGIMGNQGHADGQGTDLQRFATCHEAGRFKRLAHPALGTTTHVHRHIVAPGQHPHAMHMISMFVGDQNRAQLVRADTQTHQAAFGFPQRETAIHQYTGAVAGYQRAIPLATTTENGKTHRISPGCLE